MLQPLCFMEISLPGQMVVCNFEVSNLQFSTTSFLDICSRFSFQYLRGVKITLLNYFCSESLSKPPELFICLIFFTSLFHFLSENKLIVILPNLLQKKEDCFTQCKTILNRNNRNLYENRSFSCLSSHVKDTNDKQFQLKLLQQNKAYDNYKLLFAYYDEAANTFF